MALKEEETLSMEACDVVIGVWMEDGGSKHVNHSCSQNAQYVRIRLKGSVHDVVFVDAIQNIHAGIEVLIGYALSNVDAMRLVICECNSANCKGYF